MKLPTMFIQELKGMESDESRPRVGSPETPSREPGRKSEEEKATQPYTSALNGQVKNHSLLTEPWRSRPSLLSHIHHAGAFLIFSLQISPPAQDIRRRLL